MKTNYMENAITRVVNRFPLFAPGVLSLPARENSQGTSTLRTDGTCIEYNEAFIERQNQKQRNFLVLHEWFHVMLMHHLRRGERNPDIWVKAVDFDVHNLLMPMIKEYPEFLEAPTDPEPLYNPVWHGLDLYEIYDILAEDSEGGNELQAGMALDDVDDHPGNSDSAEAAQAMQQVQQAIEAGLQLAGKLEGDIPGDMQRLLGELVKPRIDWRSILIAFVQSKVKDDFTFTRPNVKFARTGMIIPSLYSEAAECMVFVGDTSCSITPEQLTDYCSDLGYAFESVPIKKLYVLWCDTEVNAVEEYERGQELELNPIGGGGTDFRPPFEYVEREGLDPVCLIYLTDGECSRFAPEPPYPVLWCVYGGGDFHPPYGEVINIDF